MAARLSGSESNKYGIDQNHDINVTPFVDVMLVLLIIFMVCAPLTVPSVHVDLPNAVAVPTPNPPVPVYITIEQNGALHLGDFPTDIDNLGGDLRKQIGKRDPSRERIFIRADKETMYGDFMGVMNKLQDNGFYSVALIGLDQSGTTRRLAP
jgi:biopolymer transport protein ExbD